MPKRAGRLPRNERTAIWPNVIGIFGAATLGEIVGLLAAVALGESDPTVWMTHIGGLLVGVIALGFVAFANITSMANILYTSIVELRQVGTVGLRKLRWEVIVGVFCIIPLLLVLVYPGMYDGFFRVIDSSVFPTEPNANLNAPIIMLAERGADRILNRPLLAPANAQVGSAPGIGLSQRSNAPVRGLASGAQYSAPVDTVQSGLLLTACRRDRYWPRRFRYRGLSIRHQRTKEPFFGALINHFFSALHQD